MNKSANNVNNEVNALTTIKNIKQKQQKKQQKKFDTSNTVNSLGNSFVSSYQKNRRTTNAIYGLDVYSIAQYLPISKKLILIILLCV